MAGVYSLAVAKALAIIERATTLEDARGALTTLLRDGVIDEAFPVGRVRGRTFYDQLIEEILNHVRLAASREELIASVLDSLAAEGAGPIASGYLVLNAYVVGDKLADVSVHTSARFNQVRVRNFSERQTDKLARS